MKDIVKFEKDGKKEIVSKLDAIVIKDTLNQELISILIQNVEENLKYYEKLKILREDVEKSEKRFTYIFNNFVLRNNIDILEFESELEMSDETEVIKLCEGVMSLINFVVINRFGDKVGKKIILDQYNLSESLIEVILRKVNENFLSLQLNLLTSRVEFLIKKK